MNALPELYRVSRHVLRPARLLFVVLATSLLALCTLIYCLTRARPSWDEATLFLLNAQALVLLVYGTSCAFSSILSEKIEGTWDFLRLAPLEPAQVTLGKLAGAPLTPYLISLTLGAWILLTTANGTIGAGQVLAKIATLAAAAFLSLSLGLLCSAEMSRGEDQAWSSTAASLGSLLGLLVFAARSSFAAPNRYYFFYNGYLSTDGLTVITAAAYGLWALLAATWRVGRDFAMPRRFWRFPAFLLFSAAYLAGFAGLRGEEPWLILLLAAPVYASASLDPDREDSWKRWPYPGGPARAWLDGLPAWMLGWAALWPAVFALTAIQAALFGGISAAAALAALKAIVLLTRDLLFLQCCYLGLRPGRRSWIIPWVLLALLYCVPLLAGLAGGLGWLRLISAPSFSIDLEGAVGAVLVLAQATLAALVLRSQVRRRREALRAAAGQP